MSNNTRAVKAAGLLMVTMMLSRILGYLRDVVIYAQYGQNRITDAYNAAFLIPDTLYMLLVGGALSSSFIPVFSSYIATGKEKEGWEVASIVVSIIMALLGVGIFIGSVYTPELIILLVPGFDVQSMDLTIKLTRIMFLQVIFMALSGISMGILHSYKHFTSPAIGSVLYNLGIIVFGILIGDIIESLWPGYGIAGFSVGVVIGAALNFAVQVPALFKIGFRFRPNFNIFHPGLIRLGKLMVPVFIGLSVSQINLFVNQNLASSLPAGGIAALHTGQRLMQLPIGIFGIAIAVAVFPTLTEYAARREREQFKRTFSLGLRSVIFITLPCAVGLAVLGVPIIRFMFEFAGGKFTHEDTLATAYALHYFTIGLAAYSAIHVLSRTFYALQNTMTPVFVGAFSIVVNIVLSILLVGPMAQGGLALAYSLAGIFNMIVLLWMVRRKVGAINGWQTIRSFVQTIIASAIMGVACYYTAEISAIIWGIETKLGQLIQISLSIGVSVLIFALIALLFRMEESEMVFDIVKRRFRRKR